MLTIGIISLSNGLSNNQTFTINSLENILNSLNIRTIKSSCIFNNNGITCHSSLRAKELMNFYKNPNINAIFDVSGGDLANEVLINLDFTIIKNNPKPFFGYSDLSVMLNSIYSQTNQETYWYQLRNIVSNESALNDFKDYFLKKDNGIFNFNYNWIQGNSMNGIIIGGNIRCTLKLAGTIFMPNFQDKILFIESYSGDSNKIASLLTQYKLMGVFSKINGIILGQFTEIEENNLTPSIEELIINIVNNPNLPIIKTSDIGHSNSSKSIVIGREIHLKK